MTYRKWERQLKKELSSLSRDEREDVLDYYYELFVDKLDAGEHEEKILQDFGSPETCALRILNETDRSPKRIGFRIRPRTPEEIVALILLTVLIIIPVFSSVYAVIVSLGAVALAGVIISIAGVLYIPVCIFVGGFTAVGSVVAHVGMGICLFGVGILICIIFWILTKYLNNLCVKALKYVYKRR